MKPVRLSKSTIHANAGDGTLSLGQIQSDPGLAGTHKRIAIIGLPVLSRGDHPLKSALAQAFALHPDWEIILMSEAYLDAFKLLRKITCDGVLARVITPQIAAVARKLHCPVVNISSLLETPGVDTVRTDFRGKGAMCAKYLLERGFSRIGIVSPPYKDWGFLEGEAGFMECIMTTGRDTSVSRHVLGSHAPTSNDLKQFGRWLETLQPPFALFLLASRHAAALMEECHGVGLRIPHQVAVIANDGDPESLGTCRPALTHACDDHLMHMTVACNRLADLMRDPRQPVRIINMPCSQLVPSASTDIFVVDDPLVARAVDYMQADFRKGINVAEVVDHTACARRRLERRFHAVFGKTIHKYIIELRIKAAKELLTASPRPKLAVVAEQCGFGEVKAFRMAFVEATGKNPADWCLAGANR